MAEKTFEREHIFIVASEDHIHLLGLVKHADDPKLDKTTSETTTLIDYRWTGKQTIDTTSKVEAILKTINAKIIVLVHN